ncbi:acetylglutamate kinase, putative [Heliomicrobium modesticaldum Ice1]|uniref:Acetylglutamate kinase n=1 Tax=Heliobacterium modesticaldum (strain ATCC 51547 / Ice1) TaxID=498761 RepID=ARGB_HELMI|nr:acetylglutamate kinase [Heliomicrobium modesticaldum]B0TCA8.1 RecName: Full=Acetylglutamate kinase; AltName: Full=N-acetyl-L-glutamate 5-phosphotransferase; AltName: Full=NAG kinase; Short=NAGK [Heliomicrobium modesticaldum Ice1]ABZ84007.1 acetylglutamate kinase, putative [Heliomicrobium modesticaldum Ice1]
MLKALEKAGILVEALPYIKKFSGKTVVIKYGGAAMVNDQLKEAVIMDVILMKLVGIHPVVVHGGGPEINGMLDRLGLKSHFIQGLRVTDESTMEVVEMVLAGKVNKEIVALIQRFGGKAVGLCGKDGGLIQAKKRFELVKNEGGARVPTDIGFVGDVVKIEPGLVRELADRGYIPVIAPIGVGEKGESYNINADTAAGELAQALKADKLVLLTDVEGILRDRKDPSSLISSLRIDDVPALVEEGVISGGMIPKVACCVEALQGGVGQTHIIDGRLPHSLLLEVFTDKGIGTMVLK